MQRRYSLGQEFEPGWMLNPEASLPGRLDAGTIALSDEANQAVRAGTTVRVGQVTPSEVIHLRPSQPPLPSLLEFDPFGGIYMIQTT